MAQKLVEYWHWCDKCKYKDIRETDEPCNDCLNNTTNEDSHKPVYFEDEKKSREKHDL